MTGQLSNTIAAKLTAVEVTLKDNVSKVVKSKASGPGPFTPSCPKNPLRRHPPLSPRPLSRLQNTTDAIGRAAAEAMQGPIQAAYKDTFQSIVLPVFERGCQSMFQQINDSFKQGTHECKAAVQKRLLTKPHHVCVLLTFSSAGYPACVVMMRLLVRDDNPVPLSNFSPPADIQQLETHLKNRKQREQETRDPLVGQLQQMIDGFQSSTDQLASNITAGVRAEVQHQIQMMVGKYAS